MGACDPGPGTDMYIPVYIPVCPDIYAKKAKVCGCITLGFEPKTLCILNGILYRYATSVHTLVILVVRTRYLYCNTLCRTTMRRGCALLSRPA